MVRSITAVIALITALASCQSTPPAPPTAVVSTQNTNDTRIAKTLFGAFSLPLMLLTKQHQSIHDFLSGSVVVFKNEAIASPAHKMEARETTFQDNKPSVGRRLIVISVYSVMMFMIYAAASSLLVSSQCSSYGQCKDIEIDKLVLATTMIWASNGIVLIFGLLGKLPGAYYRGNTH